jgi:hypothetical protein
VLLLFSATEMSGQPFYQNLIKQLLAMISVFFPGVECSVTPESDENFARLPDLIRTG